MAKIRYVNDFGNGHSGYIDYGSFQVKTVSGETVETLPNGEAGSDAFGRVRVAEPLTIFDSQHRYVENDKWTTASGGSASTAYRANESAINLTVTTASGDSIYRETKRTFSYQPGKSLLVTTSFVFAPGQNNLRQRVGYFGVNNGIYLEQENGILYFVIRSYVSGSVVNTRVPQDQWNGDPLNGLGISKTTLDITKGNIFWCDMEWLGVGDVRCGFVINGKLIVCHRFRNSNKQATTYMTTACLPIRQEIENIGVIASGTTAKQICSSVISEGGYQAAGETYVVDIGTTAKNLATAGTTYPVISIRLTSTRLDAIVIPRNIDGIVLSNSTVKWSLILNPTLSGASYVAHPHGHIDYDVTASGLSGGTTINGGYIETKGQITLTRDADFANQLGRTINGVSDVLTLAATPISNNTNVLFALQWIEVI